MFSGLFACPQVFRAWMKVKPDTDFESERESESWNEIWTTELCWQISIMYYSCNSLPSGKTEMYGWNSSSFSHFKISQGLMCS